MYLTKTILLFPIEILEKNQSVRSFLIKSNKEFFTLFKTYGNRNSRSSFVLPMNFLNTKRRGYSQKE
jgi:hypothetical protein